MADFSRSRKSKNVRVVYAGQDWPLDGPEAKLFFEDRKNRQRTDGANAPMDAGEYVSRASKKQK